MAKDRPSPKEHARILEVFRSIANEPGVDFRKTLELLNTKYSYEEIAKIIGSSRSTIFGISTGTEPHHNTGESLFILYCELFTPLAANGELRPPWVKPPLKPPPKIR